MSLVMGKHSHAMMHSLWLLLLNSIITTILMGVVVDGDESHSTRQNLNYYDYNYTQTGSQSEGGSTPYYGGQLFGSEGIVRVSGTRFVLNGFPFFVNGFNAYYLTLMAANLDTRPLVSQLLKEASSSGLNVVRTWAFKDGGSPAMQISPGVYDESLFQAMDFVLNEAKANGMRLILAFSNNFPGNGGKPQYAQWAREAGVSVSSDDAFYYDATIKGYYKNYVKTVVTRVNSISGVAYKDDPAIFAWELANEPRCQADPSGNTLQDWLEEISSFVKSLDANHMLEAGLEGFYGSSTPAQLDLIPGEWDREEGCDFLRNHLISELDFVTVHLYPEKWLPSTNFQGYMSFTESWVKSHLEFEMVLKKPTLFTEFGMTKDDPNFSVGNRDMYLSFMYDMIFSSANSGGSAAGSTFWQLMPQGHSWYGDGYDVVILQDSSTAKLIGDQTKRLYVLSNANL